MRLPVLSLLVLSVSVLCTACVEDETFQYCPFDPCLWKQCSEDPGGAEGTRVAYSCAVAQHPQCPEDVCLRFEGSGPFCTKTCDPALSDADCPDGSRCIQYLGATAAADAVYYCVPPTEQLPEADPDDGGTCPD